MQSNASHCPLLSQAPLALQVSQLGSHAVWQQMPDEHTPTLQSELTLQFPPRSLCGLTHWPWAVHSCPGAQPAQQRLRLLPSAARTQALVEHWPATEHVSPAARSGLQVPAATLHPLPH